MTGKKQTFVDSLNVNSLVATHVIIAGGAATKERLKSRYCSLKYVKDVSAADHLSFVPNVTNVPVTPDLPVGARLHQCWEK